MISPVALRPAVGLFSGIGGLELGLRKAGFEAVLLADNYEPASHVLRVRFPDAKLFEDVRDLTSIPPETEILAAGFPCQDLSSVGPKTGIEGTRSSLVGEVFRLISQTPVPWLVLENVPFILSLDKGRAISLVTSALDELGYQWAYRVIDAQCFGIPQRRRRWFLVASLVGDPRAVLLEQEAKPRTPDPDPECYGFYWTEGTRALGWAPNVVPPLKCGSTVGVASPPAIFTSERRIVLPDIRDAERLQGFRVDWTRPAEEVAKPGFRWKLVGNAVSVKSAEWVAQRIALNPKGYDQSHDVLIEPGSRWPNAAWGGAGRTFASPRSDCPVWKKSSSVESFLRYPTKPLSERACRGFLSRVEKGSLRVMPEFIDAVHRQIRDWEGGFVEFK